MFMPQAQVAELRKKCNDYTRLEIEKVYGG